MIGIVERGQERASASSSAGTTGVGGTIAVVIRVPEDELAGGNAVAADAGDRRLCDAVVKPERLVIAVRPVAALHAAGELGHAALPSRRAARAVPRRRVRAQPPRLA